MNFIICGRFNNSVYKSGLKSYIEVSLNNVEYIANSDKKNWSLQKFTITRENFGSIDFEIANMMDIVGNISSPRNRNLLSRVSEPEKYLVAWRNIIQDNSSAEFIKGSSEFYNDYEWKYCPIDRELHSIIYSHLERLKAFYSRNINTDNNSPDIINSQISDIENIIISIPNKIDDFKIIKTNCNLGWPGTRCEILLNNGLTIELLISDTTDFSRELSIDRNSEVIIKVYSNSIDFINPNNIDENNVIYKCYTKLICGSIMSTYENDKLIKYINSYDKIRSK